VHGADGTRLLIRGALDATPQGYGNVATKLVIVDATARPL